MSRPIAPGRVEPEAGRTNYCFDRSMNKYSHSAEVMKLLEKAVAETNHREKGRLELFRSSQAHPKAENS